MLGSFLRADENDRNIPAVALFQDRIVINIDFAEDGVEFRQNRGDRGFGFLAKVASWTRVESDVAWAGSGKAGVFGVGAHRLEAKPHLTGSRRHWEERGIMASSLCEPALRERRNEMGRVVALMDDLFFQMKLAETAKQLGVEVKVATNGDAFLGLMASEPKLVIVDLNARSQPLEAIEKLRQTRKDVRVVGFLSHVQTELAAQAKAAGCDEVLPRSGFTQNLAAILGTARD